MKYADKIGMRYVLVVGSDEFETRKAEIRDMRSEENFVSDFINVVLKNS